MGHFIWGKIAEANHITSNFLKAVFNNFYLVHCWILWPIYVFNLSVTNVHQSFPESSSELLQKFITLRSIDPPKIYHLQVKEILWPGHSISGGSANQNYWKLNIVSLENITNISSYTFFRLEDILSVDFSPQT